jgi:hypothetical protein
MVRKPGIFVTRFLAPGAHLFVFLGLRPRL